MTSTHQQAPIASLCRRCFARPSSARASRGALRARPSRRVASRARADEDDASASRSSSTELTVTTFNVLAPCYKRVKSPDGSVAMEATYPEIAVERQTRIVDMLSELASSIVCLQEVWHASEDVRGLYERGLAAAGYVVHVTPRTGGRPDGLLTAVRSADFDVVERRDILFNDCGDRVAALLHLRHKSKSEPDSDSGRSDSLGDVLLVNTHLLFPHNSNSTLIRLRESFKILEYLHEYQESAAKDVVGAGGKSRRLPVVMCGDFNGTIRGSVSRFLQSQGFYSAFEACERERDPSRDGPTRWISHLNHHGECVGVDHIWVLNPSKQSAQTGVGAPPPSWKTAIYAMIQAKMLERGLATNDDAFAFFDVDESLGITRDEFETAVRMLDLTGEGSPGLLRGEIEMLYDDCDKDGDGLVDFGEFIRKLDVESMERAYRAIRQTNGIEEGPWDVVGDLMATAASPTVLAGFTVDEDEDEDEEGFGGFEEASAAAVAASRRDLRATRANLPPAMAAGRWPEADEFDLSDHGPLTATLAPRGKARAAAEAFVVG